MARDYLCDRLMPDDELYRSFIALIMRSRAKACIIPLQDYLGLDNRSRINKPSTVGTNWRWRITGKQLSEKLRDEIRETALRYGRMNWE